MQFSVLNLNEQRWSWLEQTSLRRLDELRDEVGLGSDGSILSGGETWMSKRRENQDTYDGDFRWRKIPGSVFTKSNFTKGSNKRYVRNLASRIKQNLVGTRPFFGAMRLPMGQHEDATIKYLEDWVHTETDSSNLQKTLEEAIRCALIVNESVVKITHRVDFSHFVGPCDIIVDADGIPLVTHRGEFIYRDDDLFPDPVTQGVYRVRKDPAIEVIGSPRLHSFDSLRQRRVTYSNIDLRIKDFRSFLCPLSVEDIHEADMIAELRDIPWDELPIVYGMAKPFVDYHRIWSPASGERIAKEAHGEQAWREGSNEHQLCPFAEIYRRVDADEDGYPEELFMVFDLMNEKLVFADYLFNHMGKRPFEVIHGVEKVNNRWYGVGVMELMRDHGLYIDAQFNRINVRDGRSDSIRFRRKNAVKQWKDGSPPVFGTDDVYDVEPGGGDANDPPIWSVNLTEPSQSGVQLMMDMERSSDLLFGVVSAAESSASGLNESKSATGVLNRERAGERLSNDVEREMMAQIEKVLHQVVETLIENMPPMVAMYGESGEILSMISRSEARDMERHVRLLLTKTRSTEQLAVQTQAIQLIEAYWNALRTDPVKAFYVRDHYVSSLKALEEQEPDKKLPAITLEEARQKAAKISEAAQLAQDPPPKEFLNYQHAPPSVRRQMEEAAGYEPAPEIEDAERSES